MREALLTVCQLNKLLEQSVVLFVFLRVQTILSLLCSPAHSFATERLDECVDCLHAHCDFILPELPKRPGRPVPGAFAAGDLCLQECVRKDVSGV